MPKTLKQLRLDAGYTQVEVAKKINKTKTYISYLENGERRGSDTTKMQLAKLYGVDIRDIFLAIQ